MYCQERRTIAQKENPEMSSRDITKILGEEWKKMSSNEKRKYCDQYLEKSVQRKNELYGNPSFPTNLSDQVQGNIPFVIHQHISFDGKELSFKLPIFGYPCQHSPSNQ